MEDLGRTNPWSLNWFYSRKKCVPCNVRQSLAKEPEEKILAMVEKINKLGGRKMKIISNLIRKDCKAKASCTGEVINYIIV